MGNAGNTWVKSPHIDALASSGTKFEKAFCTFPLCSPARASHFTGLMPHQTGVNGNHVAIREGLTTKMGQVFRDAGYETIWAGKWHIPEWYPREQDTVPGFRSVPYHSGPDDETTDRRYTDEAIQYLCQNHNKPFLLSLQIHNPHNICRLFHDDLPQGDVFPDEDQLPPLPENHEDQTLEPEVIRQMRIDEMKGYRQVHKWDDFDWRLWRYLYRHYAENGDQYAGELLHRLKDKRWDGIDWRKYRYVYYRLVEKLDMQVGRIRRALRENGLEEDTLVVFTSDHGDGMGSHKWTRKMMFYEEAVHVPMILSWKGVIPEGVTDAHHLISGIDILPTLCDYAGINLTKGLPGTSLKPWIENPSTEGRQYVVAESMSAPEITDESWKGRMVRTHNHKYVIFDRGKNREMLFDLGGDPLENVNVAADPAFEDMKNTLRGHLKDWCRQTGDDFIYELSPQPPDQAYGTGHNKTDAGDDT